jgi:hypothetical protein
LIYFREQIRRIVRLPNIIPIEYKRHQDSLEDRSSYRNPSMVWRAPSKVHHDKDNSGNRPPYNNFNKGGEGNKFQGRSNFSEQNNGGAGANSYQKPWKGGNRWANDNENGASAGEAPRVTKDKESVNQETGSGWRRVGASGKPEPASFNSRPQTRPAPEHSSSEPSNTGRGDGWTKIKNPFNKSENS